MGTDVNDYAPAAFSVPRAIQYSGLTRTYLYANRQQLDWFRASRRSLITRASLDALIAALPRASRPLPPPPVSEVSARRIFRVARGAGKKGFEMIAVLFPLARKCRIKRATKAVHLYAWGGR